MVAAQNMAQTLLGTDNSPKGKKEETIDHVKQLQTSQTFTDTQLRTSCWAVSPPDRAEKAFWTLRKLCFRAFNTKSGEGPAEYKTLSSVYPWIRELSTG
jgi:hypothetical protein